MTKHVAVIGAGIVGVSTALWLQRAGAKVTLIDREGPAAGTSYGNAGILASFAIVPVATPGLWKQIPSLLFNPNKPLFLRWSYLPKILPFLIRMLRNSGNAGAISKHLNTMLFDASDQHMSLAKGTSAEAFIRHEDFVFGYTDKAAFEQDAFAWELRRDAGLKFAEMTAEDLAEFDPAMAGRFGYAVRCENHAFITDPGAYVTALCDQFTRKGGTLLLADVHDISDGSVHTDQGRLDVNDIVLTAGIWSGALMKKLGYKNPLESERGYHLEFVNPSIKPRTSMMVTAGKFGMTPMEGRLRCAGTVEFGGIKAGPSRAPFKVLKANVDAILPDLTYDRIDEWMGHRPSTVDALPLIGKLAKTNSIWAGFGHQHVGLTGGPKTGRWLAQLIMGQSPNDDLSGFDPDRFG